MCKTYIQRERESDRERDTERDRQTDLETTHIFIHLVLVFRLGIKYVGDGERRAQHSGWNGQQ